MNNKKLSRLLEPNLKLYFLCLALFTLAAAAVSWKLALIEGAAAVGLCVYFTKRNRKRLSYIVCRTSLLYNVYDIFLFVNHFLL